jgi:hypothetical protein
MLRGEFVDKSAEGVKKEVLDHHLQNEDLSAVFLEGVADDMLVSTLENI